MNNRNIIESFFDGSLEQDILLIPKINASTDLFYQLLIEDIAKKLGEKITNKINHDKINLDNNGSLFENQSVTIIDTSANKIDIKHIKEVSAPSNKFFIFLPYMNFKKQSEKIGKFINSYNYKLDIKEYLKKLLLSISPDKSIDYSSDIFVYLMESPHFLFTEAEKIIIQKKPDTLQLIQDDNNSIVGIRKEIYKLKNNFSLTKLKPLYNLIKREVKQKKFNF